tara:strand:+ start:461 stop:580 length:120 start_codon:yes stop_codon:yes gene_type:complete
MGKINFSFSEMDFIELKTFCAESFYIFVGYTLIENFYER